MTTTNFPVLDFYDEDATLHVQTTDEGIIVDVVSQSGEVVATWGATAQELADLCS